MIATSAIADLAVGVAQLLDVGPRWQIDAGEQEQGQVKHLLICGVNA
jgi:hypothetical protein